MTDAIPPPRYTIWQAIAASVGLATRAIEEVRAVAARPSKLPVVKEWSERVYYEGEVIVYDGQTFQARCDTGRPPPHDDWICLAVRGRDGLSFNVRGTWAKDEAYKALDVVALGGGSFAARLDNPGPCPGEGWQLIARQGKPGAQGERGPRGEPGPVGPAPVLLDLDSEGLLTLQLGDGTELTCDFYPVLARLAR